MQNDLKAKVEILSRYFQHFGEEDENDDWGDALITCAGWLDRILENDEPPEALEAIICDGLV